MVYTHSGVGQAVVLLHGFLEERSMWQSLELKLRSEFRVISIDLLGHGETSSLGYVHEMEDQAEIVAQVINTEEVTDVVLVGHSMGGYVALAFAEKYAHKIDGLVLFHSTAYPDSEEKKKDRLRVVELVQRNKQVYVNAAIPTLFAETTRNSHRSDIEHLTTVANTFTQQGIIANIRGMMTRKGRSDVLKKGQFRKLIVHGDLDSVIRTEDIKKLSELNSEIELKIIEGIGHMGHLEAKEECFSLIYEFCRN